MMVKISDISGTWAAATQLQSLTIKHDSCQAALVRQVGFCHPPFCTNIWQSIPPFQHANAQ